MPEENLGGFTPEELEVIRRYEKAKTDAQQHEAEAQKQAAEAKRLSLQSEHDGLLNEFGRDYGQISTTLSAKLQGGYMLGPYDIQWLIGYVQGSCNFLKQKYQAAAERLSQAGLPQLLTVFTAYYEDLQKAQKIYGDILQGQAAHQVELGNIWNDANKEAFKTMQDAHKDQVNAFNIANQNWWDKFNR